MEHTHTERESGVKQIPTDKRAPECVCVFWVGSLRRVLGTFCDNHRSGCFALYNCIALVNAFGYVFHTYKRTTCNV